MVRRPLEKLNLAMIGFLVVLTLACAAAGRLPAWPFILARCAAMSGAVFIIAWMERRSDRLPAPLRFVVDFYPLVIIPLVYDAMGFLIPAANPIERDAWLIAIDRAVLGVDPTVWLQRFVNPVLTDVLYLAYATFFLFSLVVGLTLWARSVATARWFVFLVTLAFYVSYLGYLLLPAQGPRAALADRHTVDLRVTPISRIVASTLDGLERNRVDAFPSGHVMVTAVCLYAAYRHARRLFYGLLPVGLLLLVSTIYCRYHYVVDVVAGLALAAAMPPLASWLYRRLDARDASFVGDAAPAPLAPEPTYDARDDPWPRD